MNQNPYLTNVALPPWTILGFNPVTNEKYLAHVYAPNAEQAARQAPTGITVIAIHTGHTHDTDTNTTAPTSKKGTTIITSPTHYIYDPDEEE